MKLLKTGVWTLVFLLVGLTGCQDDFIEGGYTGEFQSSVSRTEMENPGGLQKVGDYWVATQRVPLVGVGRVADDIPGNLVGLLTGVEDNNLEAMFDTNLENCTKLNSNVAGVELLASEGICVKDLYHTYAGGQPAGFVIKAADASLLTADVLKTMWVATSLDGEAGTDEDWEVMGDVETFNAVNLKLLSPQNSSTQVVQVTPKNPFNKIKLGFGGVSADVLSNLQIYYAFVGENPVNRITTDNFPGVSAKAEGLWATALIVPITGSMLQNDVNKMLNPDYSADTDGPKFAFLAGSPSVTVDLGDKTIPTGAEIGFKTNSGTALNLKLFGENTIEYTFADDAKETATLDGSVLGLSLLGGGNQLLSAIPKANKEVKSFKITFGGLQVDLGGTTVNYAYYRDPVKIDPSTYFGIPQEVTITSGTTYRLPKPQEGSVLYSVTGGPAMATVILSEDENYYVLQGMTVDGRYSVHAIYTDKDGKQIAYDLTVIREVKEVLACHTPITTTLYKNAKTGEPKTGGCLLCVADGSLEDKHTATNLTDPNTNNYAGYVRAISLAEHNGIVKVDAGEEINSDGKEIRVGFVMQTSSEFLSLSALDFYTIQLLDANGNVVEGTSATAENATVGLGLLGGDGSKIRYSIKTNKPFQSIELYASGVLKLDLSLLRIYYAFWEETTGDCADIEEGSIPGDACSEVMSAATHGLDIWYQKTVNQALASVQSYYADLSHVVDDDPTTGAVIPVTSVAGGTTLGIRFNELKGGQPIGVMLRKPSGIGDVDLLTNGLSMKVYKGVGTNTVTEVELTGKENVEGSFGLLKLNLIGFGDYIYLEATPTDEFNGIVLSFGEGLASVLKTFEVMGVYYRPDSDGNGIPDCSENPIETEDGGIDISFGGNDADICVGDAMPSITARLGVGAPTEADSYWLRLKGDNHVETFEVKIDDKNNTLVPVSEDQYLTISNPDVYSVRLYGTKDDADTDADNALSDALILTVHPEETTWNGSVSDDWNNWDNWDKGSPWDCTNVIIPSNVSRYPVLTQSDYKNGLNRCNNICFEDGGQLVNSFYLNQEESGKVWVNLKLEGGRYYLLSSPLKDMVSGDWFISNVNVAKWETIAQSNYPESRTSPYVYQRLWNTSAPIKKPAGYGNEDDKVMPDETLWTPPYNAVNQQYGIGQGFSLMAEKDKNDTYSFCFPKTHTTYHYYSLTGVETGQTEEVHQEETLSGHFIYEEANLWNSNNELTVMLSRSTGSTAYLAGNPFMAHISVEAFMNINGIREIKVYDGTQNNSLVMIDGELISSNGNVVKYIKPMEAFFIMDETSATEREVKYTTSMLSQGDNRTRMASRSASVSMPGKSMLRLTASVSGYDAQCLLRVSRKASEGVVSGEDTRLLIDGEAHPEVAVYTVADGEALDIQQIPATVTRVPLGFYLRSGKGDVELRFDYTDRLWQGWSLLDTQSGEHRSLANVINLKAVESGSTRYVLVKN